ncbi:hypothetical protein MINT15_02440 [Saccharomonospora viridis]|uniref:Uncharacterized protein n=1 Tax=Saccharomonospora viridis TaxID=1852 RepID=A0A837DDJ0_9PSEU|nr:hypothetical protein MINT15_02440 [Saccharomonospora viridis]
MVGCPALRHRPGWAHVAARCSAAAGEGVPQGAGGVVKRGWSDALLRDTDRVRVSRKVLEVS